MTPSEQIDTITNFIKDTFRKTAVSSAVIGVSGGIDSAVCLTLLAKSLPLQNIYPLLLPNGNQESVDGKMICEFNHIPVANCKTINITSAVDAIWQNILGKQGDSIAWPIPISSEWHKLQNDDNVRLGNIMARVRMITIFDSAKSLSALVCGTENKSEHYLGYFTRYGDAASDLEPIQHLYKTQVYQLADRLNIPRRFLDKAPSANLWVGQTDEQELGFSYEEADKVLMQLIDEHKNPQDIKIENLDQEVINKIINRVQSQQFKLEVPYHL